ncbi:FHA domain-containing protein [Nocardioides sp. AE5]|uniref:FHA domain-containing protein n=1 Tax=Nocardioides sp. AE5 TaxID=2962573 RepID=UPI002881CA80|nr:FHA domain-containing protein [Nocardioides sp. AE5]MDT0203709.1 FHA domain-containing protein [Nocardioides sp. AE5]
MTESISADRSYRPGGWYAVFGAEASVLLPESEKARVAALWEQADAGAGFDELLDALIASGLRALPGFVLITAADPTRIVLRGSARATVVLPGGEEVEVDGGAAATWVERSFEEVESITLVLEDAEGDVADFPIINGLVRVSRVDRPARTQAAGVADADAAAGAVIGGVEPAEGGVEPADGGVEESGNAGGWEAPASTTGSEPAPGDPLGQQSEDAAAMPAPVPPIPAPVPPMPFPVGADDAGHADAGAGEPADDELVDDEPVDEAVAEGTGDEASDAPAATDPVLAESAEDDPEATVLDLPVIEDEAPTGGQHLAAVPAWGGAPDATPEAPEASDTPAVPAWGEPAPAQAGDHTDEPADQAPPAPPAEPVWGQPTGEAPVEPTPAAEPPSNPFGASAPDQPSNPFAPDAGDPPAWQAPSGDDVPPAPAWGAPPAPPAAPSWGDDPLAASTPAAPSWGAAPEGGSDVEDHDHDGNTVTGAVDQDQFARQHPGIPGQPQAPSVTAQPVARLVFSHGEDIEVDRAVLIGRAPEARRFTSTDQPRLVTVPSPNSEISSTHLEVRPGSGADHGSAIVTDMGSTNGTVLTQPGFAPEDLQPGIAVQLLPGAVIDLGDGVTIQVTNA